MKARRNNILQAVVVLMVLTATVVFAIQQTLPPAALPASAAATQFSALRAIEHIKVISREPRLVGEQGFDTSRDYVITTLTELGLRPQIQKSRITIPGPLLLHLGWDIEPSQDVENIVARIEGFESTDAILLVAHLDSVGGPGASDDGNGVAVLLETARALLSGTPLRNTVIFLFTAPEETGLHGGVAFILEHPWIQDVKLVVNFDAGGSNGPSELTNTSPDYGWLIRELARADPYAFGSTSSNGVSDSDFNTFKYYGFSGFAFDYSRERRRHTPMDNVENLNPDSIQHQGYHALSITRHFGNLISLQDPKYPNLIYFNFLRLGMIYYPSAWVVPIMLFVTGIFTSIIILSFRKKILTIPGMSLGVLVFVISLTTGPLFVRLLWYVMTSIVPKYQVTYYGQAENLTLLLLIFSSTSIAITSAWYALLHRIRRVSLPDLACGALSILILGMVVSTIKSPGDSFWLTWPLFFNLVAMAYWCFSAKGDWETFSWAQVVGYLVAAAVTIALFIPSIFMEFTGSATNDLFNPMLNLVVMAGCLIPPGFIFMRPQKWWFPISAELVAVGGLAVAILG